MTKRKNVLAWGVAAVVIGVTLPQVTADITGSGHDFSAYGWSDGEICKPCHTPHFADPDQPAPLWNHALTQATYTLYNSETMLETPEQPGQESRLCLSCHDGTIALDAFGGQGGTTHIGGSGLLSTDLSDDHPIGVTWSHQNPNVPCMNCHNPYGGDEIGGPLPFYNAKVECMTCHEPHANGASEIPMLRLPLLGSELCLHCHNPS